MNITFSNGFSADRDDQGCTQRSKRTLARTSDISQHTAGKLQTRRVENERRTEGTREETERCAVFKARVDLTMDCGGVRERNGDTARSAGSCPVRSFHGFRRVPEVEATDEETRPEESANPSTPTVPLELHWSQHTLRYRNYVTICAIRKHQMVPGSWEVSGEVAKDKTQSLLPDYY